jgi:hypothetical protein
LRRLERAEEHEAEGQENNRGFLRGVLQEVMGSCKNFTNFEVDDRPHHLLLKSSLLLS